MDVKKTVIRRLEFTAADMERIVIDWLEQRDQPAPNDKSTSRVFAMNSAGVTIEWTDHS